MLTVLTMFMTHQRKTALDKLNKSGSLYSRLIQQGSQLLWKEWETELNPEYNGGSWAFGANRQDEEHRWMEKWVRGRTWLDTKGWGGLAKLAWQDSCWTGLKRKQTGNGRSRAWPSEDESSEELHRSSVKEGVLVSPSLILHIRYREYFCSILGFLASWSSGYIVIWLVVQAYGDISLFHLVLISDTSLKISHF